MLLLSASALLLLALFVGFVVRLVARWLCQLSTSRSMRSCLCFQKLCFSRVSGLAPYSHRILVRLDRVSKFTLCLPGFWPVIIMSAGTARLIFACLTALFLRVLYLLAACSAMHCLLLTSMRLRACFLATLHAC